MLIEYNGTVLLVSHDRSFLNNIVTSTLVLEPEGKVGEYVGGYDDWLRQRKDANGEPEKPAKKQRPVKKKPLKLTYKQKRELEKLPEVIEKLEKQIASLDEEMAKPSFYKQDAEWITQTSVKLRSLDEKLAHAYSRWEELDAIE